MGSIVAEKIHAAALARMFLLRFARIASPPNSRRQVTTVALSVHGSQITVERDPEGNPECDLESQPRFILRMMALSLSRKMMHVRNETRRRPSWPQVVQ